MLNGRVFFFQAQNIEAHCRLLDKDGNGPHRQPCNSTPIVGSIRFRLAPRAYDAPPCGPSVRVVPDRLTKSRKIHTRKMLPLFLSRPAGPQRLQAHGTRREPFNSSPMAVNSISSDSPHVRPMWAALSTCGEPDEIKKNTGYPPRQMLPLFSVVKYPAWHHSCSVALVRDLTCITALFRGQASDGVWGTFKTLFDTNGDGVVTFAEFRCSWRTRTRTRGVMFCGWVFYLISLGGQAPHVLWAHMGRACGGPNEIELTPIGVELKGSQVPCPRAN